MLTEAYEASVDAKEALARFEEQVKLYRQGKETMAVVDMYEMAAINHGASSDQIQAVWNNHPEEK